MLLPELSRKNIDGMAPSPSFFKGLYRRIAHRPQNKVFAVGFHKTGTTSLAKALLTLGYRVCGSLNQIKDFDPSIHSREDLFNKALPLLSEYDAFEDTPWFMFYRELFHQFPEGQFILTLRSPESWYKSIEQHFGGYEAWNYHSWIYQGHGDPTGYKELYIQTYEQHNSKVIDFFRDHNKELLVMRLPDDFNWEVLCSYLKCKKPIGNFPHANTVGSRETWQRRFLDQLKQSYYRI